MLAEAPRVLIVGGPQGLYGEIFAQWKARYPKNPVDWRVGEAKPGERFDLFFAYFPTREQLDGLRSLDVPQKLGVPAEFILPIWKTNLNEAASNRAAEYLNEGGIENGLRLLGYLYSQVRKDGPKVEAPVPGLRNGIYHPAATDLFPSWEAYSRWWRERHPGHSGPVVAITFFTTLMRGRDVSAIDALIAECEARGAMPLAAFGYPLDQLTPLLQDAPQVVIALNTTLSVPKDAEIYAALGVPVLNGIVTRESAAEWQVNAKGLPADRITAHLSFPERSGLIAPTLVATSDLNEQGVRYTRAYTPGVSLMVRSALRIANLRNKPNSGKRVALLYYNNPAGKGNIGASYLQVFPSLVNIWKAMREQGYNAGDAVPDTDAMRRNLEAGGRNLELWARGEKLALASRADAVRWPVEDYLKLYAGLPEDFRKGVEAAWGAPSRNQLMTEACGSSLCMLFPAFGAGNVLLAPQPLRNNLARVSDTKHDFVTPPPHQYVAFYLWLRHVWKADAVVHVGRHGTLEWLPGKQVALAESDAPQVLLDEMPNLNIYVMDGGGEAMQSRRRGGATLISHLTPMLARTGAREDIEPLHEAFHKLTEASGNLPPELAAEYEQTARREMQRLGLFGQLKLTEDAKWAKVAPLLHEFLHEIEEAPVPLGLPVFGNSPSVEHLTEGVGAYLYSLFPADRHDEIEEHVPEWSRLLMDGKLLPGDPPELARAMKEIPPWIENLRRGGADEIAGLMNGLNGRHVPSGVLGDPLRKPDALPVGRNLHAVDSARLPTQAAWRAGQVMAKSFIERYQKEHHRMPKRASLVLWYGETERNQGAMESMAMALLGVKPVWNARGVVETLELIADAELGRPRVDVVFQVSGNYRDGFPDKMQLLDRAVRLAAGVAGSAVGVENARIASELTAGGATTAEAAEMSQIRIFGPKPGAYGVGVQSLIEQAGGKDTPANIAGLYMASMGFAYGGKTWGKASSAALKANLKGVDSVQLSRSSNLYSALDNDDTYQYLGGLRTAVEQVSKVAPDVLVHNLRQGNHPKLASLREWLAVEMHSRQFNPKWIEAMRDSGYAGGRQMSREIEHLYGIQKTAPDHVDSQTWQSVLDIYVKDRLDLGLPKFFSQQNPHARQTMLARLLEVDRQQIVKFPEADRRLLLRAYAQSVSQYSAACSAQVCANRALREHVSKELTSRQMDREAGDMQKAIEKATGQQQKPDAPAPVTSRWKTWQSHAITWVRQVRMCWNVDGVPAWVWWGMGLGYVMVAGVMLRPRRGVVTSVLLHPEE